MSNKRENPKTRKRIEELTQSFNNFENRKKHICFSFQFLTSGENYGQSFEEWERDGIILDLTDKLTEFSRKTKLELINDRSLVIYKGFPENSMFSIPKSIPLDGTIEWARLRMTGRRRVAGFFSKGNDRESDVFYIVFLDQEHQFYPSVKQHT